MQSQNFDKRLNELVDQALNKTETSTPNIPQDYTSLEMEGAQFSLLPDLDEEGQAAQALRTTANQLLKSDPTVSPKVLSFWKKLTPLDLKILKDFWIMADPENQCLDLQKVLF